MNWRKRELYEEIIGYLEAIEECLDEWQDEDRTYTPAERQLDVRLDRRAVPA